MKVKSESEVALSCLTLSDPMDCSLPGSSIRRIFQARVLEWGAIHVSKLLFAFFLVNLSFIMGSHLKTEKGKLAFLPYSTGFDVICSYCVYYFSLKH